MSHRIRHPHDHHEARRSDRPGRRRRRFALSPSDRLASLERYQRDLEQELADVVSRIDRLRTETAAATVTDDSA